MKRPIVLFHILLVSLLAFNCSGTRYRGTEGERILLASGDVHNGWYFAGGAQVDIDGTINGDAFIAGGVVNIRGTVNGLLAVAGGEVNVTGNVTDRLIATGGVVRLSGKTEKSLFAGGGSLVIEKGATVGEYLLAGGGDVQVRGTVARNAMIGAGTLRVSGEIGGDLNAGVDKFATDPGSRIGGNLIVTAKDTARVQVAPGTVLGQISIKAEKQPEAPQLLGMSTGKIVVRILFFLSLCAIALVLSFLFPRQLASAGTIINGRPGEVVLVGLGVLLLTIPVFIVLCLTVVGIPLGIFLLFYVCWLGYLSQMCLGIFLAYRLFSFDGKRGWSLFGPVALGILMVCVCTFIPFVNVVIVIAGLILGIGSLSIITQEHIVQLKN